MASVARPPSGGASKRTLLACEPGRGSRENVALQPQLLVLTPQPGQLVALGRGQPIALLLPAALFPVRLRHQ